MLGEFNSKISLTSPPILYRSAKDGFLRAINGVYGCAGQDSNKFGIRINGIDWLDGKTNSSSLWTTHGFVNT